MADQLRKPRVVPRRRAPVASNPINIERVQELQRRLFNAPASKQEARERMKHEVLLGFTRAMLICHGEEQGDDGPQIRNYHISWDDLVGLLTKFDPVLSAIDEVEVRHDPGAAKRLASLLAAARDPGLQRVLGSLMESSNG